MTAELSPVLVSDVATPLTRPPTAVPASGLPPYPRGWYAMGFADELPPGKVLARPFMGSELVLFRTQLGQACAVDPHCPHLGAHLGHGATVEGEHLRCPFHGFRYDRHGACIATGYGSKPPPSARLRTWPLREVNSTLLVHYDPGAAPPGWEIPGVDSAGWSAPVYRRFTLSAHPQVTTENSVDVGHFSTVHGYRDVRMLRELRIDGAYLSTAYAARRAAPLVGRWWQLDFEFETHIYGLGYSRVDVWVRGLDIRARLWVLPTPIGQGRMALYLAASGQEESGGAHRWLRVVPPTLRGALIARGLLAGLAHDARQDFAIWENARYTHPPALAHGDGPIGKYRTWAATFYA